MSARTRTLLTLGLAGLASGLASGKAVAADAPPAGTSSAAPRVTVTAVTTDGTPVRYGVVALERSDDGLKFADVTTLSLDAEGQRSWRRPSAGLWRARLVSGDDAVLWTQDRAHVLATFVRSPAIRVTDGDPGPDLRIVAPLAGRLRVRVPAAVGSGTTILRRPSAPYALAPVPEPIDRLDEPPDASSRPEAVLRWRGVPPGPWQVVLRAPDSIALAAEVEVHARRESDVTLPAPSPAAGPTLRYDGPSLGPGGDSSFTLDRWDDARRPDHAAGSGRGLSPTFGLRPGAYLLRLRGHDVAQVVRHDGTARTIRVAPPTPPSTGGVTVTVRVRADGLDVHRVVVGLAAGDASLADGTWLRWTSGRRFDHVPPGRHTIAILDGLDLYVVGIPGGVHTRPLDVGSTDLTATVDLR